MQLDALPLGDRQGLPLLPDQVGDADPAEVVKVTGAPEPSLARRGQAGVPAGSCRQGGPRT